ncbi:MAG: TonB-dependent receptor [Saprospiraceae bacterium]|uniref:TonB-dependent receptor n=1 Tax=Candidatus Opimibacter skivensis TaxID=2982028 RepID=A0A9D7STZ4_9BACT|nr:TonB-dependent receptor [Candidatus Opimibacter skivensis]
MKYIFYLAILFFVILLRSNLQAQNYTQTVYGKVIDKANFTALPQASIEILNTTPQLGTTSLPDGSFIIPFVPVGIYSIRVTSIGFATRQVDNIVVSSGKQSYIEIALEEVSTQLNEVVVKSETDKKLPVNSMSIIGARMFSVEETQKFAASIDDPSRMVTSLPGITTTSDGNDISIRGNSANGVLWRLEGIEIPNPNHFANIASSGGAISILNSQLLANSDFLNSAFSAEYGDALSGVFDLRLRKGNYQKREYTAQLGFLGMDASAEGPLHKNYNGSYLINYRYSTLALIQSLGIPLADGIIKFQDLAYNIYLPTKRLGSFTLFGLGGKSSKSEEETLLDFLGSNTVFKLTSVEKSNTAVTGLTHSKIINAKLNIRSVIAISGYQIGNTQKRQDGQEDPRQIENNQYRQSNAALSSTLNIQTGRRHWIKTGISPTLMQYSVLQTRRDSANALTTILDHKGSSALINSFVQWFYNSSYKFSANIGFHIAYFTLNKSKSLEPRAAIRIGLTPNNFMSIGYGLHSQIQPLGTYFYQERGQDNQIQYPNHNLSFTRAHHFVLSEEYDISNFNKIKLEVYYQALFNVPISPDTADKTSILNVVDEYLNQELVSNGLGKNYGIELSEERFLHNNLYYIFSASVYQSKYKAADHIWRNTRFNGNYTFAFTAGKEFTLSGKNNKSTGSVNFRTLYLGGFRTTPIDVEKSETYHFTAEETYRAFEKQLPPYVRVDLKLSYRHNFKNSTLTTSLDIQNVLNKENASGEFYDTFEKKINYTTSNGLIPVLNIKVEF